MCMFTWEPRTLVWFIYSTNLPDIISRRLVFLFLIRLIMTAAVSFSYASPLDHMHPLRPLRCVPFMCVVLVCVVYGVCVCISVYLSVHASVSFYPSVCILYVCHAVRYLCLKYMEASTLSPSLWVELSRVKSNVVKPHLEIQSSYLDEGHPHNPFPSASI